MLVDITFPNEECHLEFQCQNFNEINDFAEAILIIETISGDFNVEPEISEEDLKELIRQAHHNKQSTFIVEISEEGVDALA